MSSFIRSDFHARCIVLNIDMSTSPMAFPIKNESLQNHCNGTLHRRQLDTSRKPDSYSRKIQENQRAGVQAALPYIAAQFHSRVEVHGVDRVQIAQGQCQGVLPLRDRYEMNVVCHKAVSPDRKAMALRVFIQESQIGFPVRIILEHIGPAVAPLRNMMRISRHNNSRYPAHGHNHKIR